MLGRVANIKDILAPSIYINYKSYQNKGAVVNNWMII